MRTRVMRTNGPGGDLARKASGCKKRLMNPIYQVVMLVWCLSLTGAMGQDQPVGSNRQAVRLKDPTRPALVKVSLLNGSIRVRGYEGQDILVETHPSNDRPNEAVPSGSQAGPGWRTESAIKGLKMAEEDNVVSVTAGPNLGAANLEIQVPTRTSLKLACQQGGEILVEKVEGELEASGLNGSVTLLEVSGAVVVHSLNGQVKVSFQRVTPDKPMSFSTLNGDIDVTLPADTKATVKLETLNGTLQSDFEIQPKGGNQQPHPGAVANNQPVWMTEKVRVGTINGGGPEFQMKAFNGNIHLRKKQD